jgi:hypothetical protein
MLLIMNLEPKTNEELVQLLRDLEAKYIQNLTSKFNKERLAETWEEVKEIKEELAKREEKRMF